MKISRVRFGSRSGVEPARANVSAVTRGAYKNRSYLRRPLRAGQEKSCQIAALASRNVPICARIAYGFHLGPRIARRASIRSASLPSSPRLTRRVPPRRGKKSAPRVLRANSTWFPHGINFSNESCGRSASLYQVARDPRVPPRATLANTAAAEYLRTRRRRRESYATGLSVPSDNLAPCKPLRRDTPASSGITQSRSSLRSHVEDSSRATNRASWIATEDSLQTGTTTSCVKATTCVYRRLLESVVSSRASIVREPTRATSLNAGYWSRCGGDESEITDGPIAAYVRGRYRATRRGRSGTRNRYFRAEFRVRKRRLKGGKGKKSRRSCA